MRTLKLFLLIVLITGLFYLLKVYISFPVIKIELLGIILTISSILFGLLGAFFISELWSKYTEARGLQGVWSSNMQDMIFYASHFYKDNKNFERNFKLAVEKYCIVDAIIGWEEMEKEEKYLSEIGKTFNLIKVKELKGGEPEFLDNMMDAYSRASEALSRLMILGKERLFPSEWLILTTLALIICASVLFLETTITLYSILTFIFPGIIVLTFWLLYNLDIMGWNIESVSFEPYLKILDTLGVKRFYLTKYFKMGIKPKTKDYRTEKNLTGELKEIYLNLIKK